VCTRAARKENPNPNPNPKPTITELEMSYVFSYSSVQLDKRRVEKEFTTLLTYNWSAADQPSIKRIFIYLFVY